jgi:hypothetical protein
VAAAYAFAEENPTIKKIAFVLFSEKDYAVYVDYLDTLKKEARTS